MEDFISAIQSNDLVKAKKAAFAFLSEASADLIEARKIEIAASVMIEGEEADDEDDEDEDESDDESEKDEKSDDKDEDE